MSGSTPSLPTAAPRLLLWGQASTIFRTTRICAPPSANSFRKLEKRHACRHVLYRAASRAWWEQVAGTSDQACRGHEIEKIFSEHADVLRLTAFFAHQRLQAALENEHRDIALSPREKECLLWVAQGLRSKQIADKLGLRPVTVELHLKNARTKLRAATREQAIAIALLNGLISP